MRSLFRRWFLCFLLIRRANFIEINFQRRGRSFSSTSSSSSLEFLKLFRIAAEIDARLTDGERGGLLFFERALDLLEEKRYFPLGPVYKDFPNRISLNLGDRVNDF